MERRVSDRPIVSLLVMLGAGIAVFVRATGGTSLGAVVEALREAIDALVAWLANLPLHPQLVLGLLLAAGTTIVTVASLWEAKETLCYSLATARNADKREAYAKLIELREFLRRMSERLTITYIVDSRGARIVARGRRDDIERLRVGLRDFADVFLFTECSLEHAGNSPRRGWKGVCITYAERWEAASTLHKVFRQDNNIAVIDWKGALEEYLSDMNAYTTLSSIKSIKEKALKTLEAITAVEKRSDAGRVLILVDPIEMLTNDALSKALYAALNTGNSIHVVIVVTSREDFDTVVERGGEWIARDIRRRLRDCLYFLERASRRSSAAERPAVGGAPVSPTRLDGLPAHPTPQHTLGRG